MRSFCRKKTHVHKIPRFRVGGYFGFGGGGSADFIFMGARLFLNSFREEQVQQLWRNTFSYSNE